MITVFEVGPRDGLQNEKRKVSLKDKLWLIEKLVGAGLRELEVGAFVRADLVPQMADTKKLYEKLHKKSRLAQAHFWSLVPNVLGFQRALDAKVQRIAVFTAASESFNLKNIKMSVSQSLKECSAIVKLAHREGMKVRGYVSTAFGCPYEGKISPLKTLGVIESLAETGVSQVSIGDTIGVATPKDVEKVVGPALKYFGEKKIALHFHDTRGMALVNAYCALELGVRVLDSSAGGLGGCPFAPGATGNLATEDLVGFLNGQGIQTGVDLKKLCQLSLGFAQKIRRPISSRTLQAYASALCSM